MFEDYPGRLSRDISTPLLSYFEDRTPSGEKVTLNIRFRDPMGCQFYPQTVSQ